MDKVLEEAIKKGVPLPATCNKMEWKEETFLSWLETKMDNESVEYSVVKTSDYKHYKLGFFQKLIPAPQIQEICQNIPVVNDQFGCEVDLDLTINTGTKSGVLEFYNPHHSVMFNHYHLAQAFSEFYLNLKADKTIQ